jgi:hypothetical protein
MWHGIVVGRVLNFELTIVAELEGLIVPLAFVPLSLGYTSGVFYPAMTFFLCF